MHFSAVVTLSTPAPGAAAPTRCTTWARLPMDSQGRLYLSAGKMQTWFLAAMWQNHSVTKCITQGSKGRWEEVGDPRCCSGFHRCLEAPTEHKSSKNATATQQIQTVLVEHLLPRCFLWRKHAVFFSSGWGGKPPLFSYTSSVMRIC